MKANHEYTQPTEAPAHGVRYRIAYGLVGLSILWIVPLVACGSFQPRPTPVPTPVVLQGGAAQPAPQQVLPTATVALVAPPTNTPVPQPTATFTPTPAPGTVLIVGEPARIAAAGGLNIREQPGTGAPVVTRLGFGQRVTVTSGPVNLDGYTWWQVDDGQGNLGWGAAGDGSEEWITPRIGQAQAVNRSPRVGDRVVVSIDGQLTVRALPGTTSTIVTRVNPGSEFTILAGPQAADGYLWFQIRSDDGQVEGWAADGQDGDRWLSPLE